MVAPEVTPSGNPGRHVHSRAQEAQWKESDSTPVPIKETFRVLLADIQLGLVIGDSGLRVVRLVPVEQEPGADMKNVLGRVR